MTASATRTTAVWVPDWPVAAAVADGRAEPHEPVAVHDGRRVTAVSATARAAGVRRGMRRRQARECCPELVLVGRDPGRDARVFEPVAVAAESVVAGVEVARPGLLLLPAAGASRYHGSELTLAERLVTAVALEAGHECHVGVGDGLLAAVLAARVGLVLPPGTAPEFLAPLGVQELQHAATDDAVDAAELTALLDLLHRLGLRSLGELAAVPTADVLARFGRTGLWAHRLARGEDLRPPAARRPEQDIEMSTAFDPPAQRVDVAAFAARRLAEDLHAALVHRSASCGLLEITATTEDGRELSRTWRADTALGGLDAGRITDRVRWQLEGWLDGRATGAPQPAPLARLELRALEVTPAGAEQDRLWGALSGADQRAHRAVLRVQGLLGADAVLAVALQGGRDARTRVHLVPWGERGEPARPLDRPWPGGLPEPAPATVLAEPAPVEVVDDAGRPVRLTERGELTDPPALLRGGGADLPIDAWAGPWPVVERWWGPHPPRRARLQVTTPRSALLLALDADRWTVEARYD